MQGHHTRKSHTHSLLTVQGLCNLAWGSAVLGHSHPTLMACLTEEALQRSAAAAPAAPLRSSGDISQMPLAGGPTHIAGGPVHTHNNGSVPHTQVGAGGVAHGGAPSSPSPLCLTTVLWAASVLEDRACAAKWVECVVLSAQKVCGLYVIYIILSIERGGAVLLGLCVSCGVKCLFVCVRVDVCVCLNLCFFRLPCSLPQEVHVGSTPTPTKHSNYQVTILMYSTCVDLCPRRLLQGLSREVQAHPPASSSTVWEPMSLAQAAWACAHLAAGGSAEVLGQQVQQQEQQQQQQQQRGQCLELLAQLEEAVTSRVDRFNGQVCVCEHVRVCIYKCRCVCVFLCERMPGTCTAR